MSDEFAIREVAEELQDLYARLDEAKHMQPRPREVRVMRPAPGPAAPGNFLWISRAIDMEQRLREVGLNALSDIGVMILDGDGRAQQLLQRIYYNAQPISELPWAADFLDELTEQARKLGRWLNPPEPAQVAKRLEPYHRAEVIIQRAAQHGHRLTRKGLHEMARRSQNTNHPITSEIYGGRSTYRFTEVLAYLNRNRTTSDN